MSAASADRAIGSVERLSQRGEPVERVELRIGGCEIGRSAGGLACPDDHAMEAVQARIVDRDDDVFVQDAGGGSGVWIRLQDRDGRRLETDDQIWVGAQILVVERDVESEVGYRLQHHGSDGGRRGALALPPEGLMIGRASAAPLDPTDALLSRRHAQVVVEEGELRLYDRGARNGTFVRVTAPERLVEGTEFRAGSSRFRFVAAPEAESAGAPTDEPGEATDYGSPLAPRDLPPKAERAEPERADRALTPIVPAPAGLGARLRRLGRSQDERGSSPRVPDTRGTDAETETLYDGSLAPSCEPEDDAPEAADPRLLVVIDAGDDSVSIEARPGGTILEAVREAGLERGHPVDWECEDGRCGICILGVVEGADRMDPPDPGTGEMKTIQITEQVAPDPRRYRLTCLARVRGTVRLRKLT